METLTETLDQLPPNPEFDAWLVRRYGSWISHLESSIEKGGSPQTSLGRLRPLANYLAVTWTTDFHERIPKDDKANVISLSENYTGGEGTPREGLDRTPSVLYYIQQRWPKKS